MFKNDLPIIGESKKIINLKNVHNLAIFSSFPIKVITAIMRQFLEVRDHYQKRHLFDSRIHTCDSYNCTTSSLFSIVYDKIEASFFISEEKESEF